MGSTVVPLHRIELNSNVVTGTVHVGVRKSFPLPGVTFILGNDIGGGNVFPQAVEPVVLEGAQQHPAVFPACKVEGEECTVRPTRPGKQVESHPGVRAKRMPSEGPAVTVQSVAVSDIICSCVCSTSGYVSMCLSVCVCHCVCVRVCTSVCECVHKELKPLNHLAWFCRVALTLCRPC